jgi:hypothetical protein
VTDIEGREHGATLRKVPRKSKEGRVFFFVNKKEAKKTLVI